MGDINSIYKDLSDRSAYTGIRKLLDYARKLSHSGYDIDGDLGVFYFGDYCIVISLPTNVYLFKRVK